jgi:hypothetical protein
MALLGLAPDIQEAILFLPRTVRGRDPIQMYDLLPLTTILDWNSFSRLAPLPYPPIHLKKPALAKRLPRTAPCRLALKVKPIQR